MRRLFRLWLVLVVVGLNLLWLVPAGVLSGTENTGPYEMVDGFWSLDRNGGGEMVYATGELWYGTGSPTGSLNEESLSQNDVGSLSWGDDVDRRWICFWNEGYGVWDLEESYSEVVLFPWIDHPELTHMFSYAVFGTDEFNPANPGATAWVPAQIDRVYLKGWSAAGEGVYEVCNDDYVSVWDWSRTPGASIGYRFVRVNAVPWPERTSNYDAEVDAVKGVVPEEECGGWETDVVEKGRTFNYTSLEVGPDDRVHEAYGGEQLFYAARNSGDDTWHVQEVDNGGAGAYCSLALDGLGRPAISYYDAANGDLKYAYQNGTLNAVWGSSSSDIYAVGDSGTILHYDGATWNPMASPPTRTLRGIWGSSWQNIVAVGDGGTIIRFNGSTWTTMSSGTAGNLGSVWGTSNGSGGFDVFVVGDAYADSGTYYYRILQSTYNGTSWTAWSQPWTVSHGTTARNLHGIWASSASNVFAVGDSGTVIRYDGANWTTMTSGTSSSLAAVWGSSSSNVIAVGDYGTIRRFNGTTWASMISGSTDCLSGVWGTSAPDVFAVGCRGALLHWDGSSWSTMASDTTNPLYGAWGSSSSNVLAVGYESAVVGYDGTIWTSIASGNGWVTETVDHGGPVGNVGSHTSLAFDSSGRPCISYYDAAKGYLKYANWTGTGWIIKTVDGDNDPRRVGEYSSLAFDNLGRPSISYYDATNEDLRFAWWDDAEICWRTSGTMSEVDDAGDVGRYSSLAYDGAGNPAISYHDATNGDLKYAGWDVAAWDWDIDVVDSQGWVGQYTSLAFDTSYRPGISYFDAVNQDLKYAHWNGIGWVAVSVDTAGNVGSYTSLDFGVLSGDLAISYYDATNDALKAAWRSSDTSLSAVWGSSLADVFTVGEEGTISKYSGLGWPVIAGVTANRLNGVWGTSASNVWAVGDSGTILRYDGLIWSHRASGTAAPLRGVWGNSASDIFAVGDGGTVLHYDGSWSAMSSGTTRSLAGVWGTSPTNVIAVGEYGTILHYDGVDNNGDGSLWDPMPKATTVTQWLSAVWGESSSSMFAVGDGGTILYYNGTSWAPKTIGTTTTMALRGIWGTSKSDVIAVGEQGTILHFDGTKWSAMASGTTEWLRGVWGSYPGSSPSYLFAVGDAGTVLSYSGVSWSLMSTGKWNVEKVDIYPWAGRFSSLAFDASNNPAISFYDAREGDLKYAHWQRDHWVVDTVDSYGDTGRYTSLAFDSSGNPSISYYEVSRGDLKYAHWNGTTWVVTVPDSLGDVGSCSSLAFDNAGNPAIGYYDATNANLKYCRWNGSAWVRSVVDEAGLVGRFASLDFDSSGNPGISYYDETNQLLKYAQWNGSAWVIDIVDRVGYIGGNDSLCSLQFDCVDNPAISYYDAVNGDLKYAQWSGTSWEVQVVDSEGQVGLYTSLDFDGSKRPAISYHDASNGTLKLARWNDEKWNLETIDGTQAAGHYTTSLAFDDCGSPAISYDSPITGDLKYASPLNPSPGQPVNTSPANGATYVSLIPTLESAAFADPCGDSQRASQWVIATENCEVNCSPVFDSGVDLTNLLKIEVPADVLQPITTYYWSVRHQDCRGAWSKYSAKTAFTTASPPEQPVNEGPADETMSVSVTPALVASAFSDPEASDRHVASEWQITTNSDNYSAPLFDQRMERSSLTQLDLFAGILQNTTIYYWRVRYQDNHGTWSEFSLETSFTTNSMPEQPANSQPSDGESNVGRTPTLQGSPFADADAGEGHQASQWRVTSVAGNYSSPVWDSGVDESNLTEMTIPAGTLEYDTSYYWQVRYQDSQGSWSSWSAETGFSTGAAPSVPAALLIAAAVVGVVAVVAMTAPLMLPM